MSLQNGNFSDLTNLITGYGLSAFAQTTGSINLVNCTFNGGGAFGGSSANININNCYLSISHTNMFANFSGTLNVNDIVTSVFSFNNATGIVNIIGVLTHSNNSLFALNIPNLTINTISANATHPAILQAISNGATVNII